jgi:hypothetical protein
MSCSLLSSLSRSVSRSILRFVRNPAPVCIVQSAMVLCLMLLCLMSVVSSMAATAERAIMVREATLYLSPDAASQKMNTVGRGREVAIFEKSGQWLHVLANVKGELEVTAWILDKGVIRTSTPNGDAILFGEAVDSEAEGSRRRGRKGAAEDALHLYARLAEYFPTSPFAGEALFRAADIRWQIEKADITSRPSFKRDPNSRAPLTEDDLKQVQKKYPNTKWADMAAFDLLDNKLCGDWLGSSKCPEKEAELYEKYATERPSSPKAAEALYEAATRRAALVEIYKSEGDSKKSSESRSKAAALVQRIISQYAQTDWGPRAQTLRYKIEQEIPTYGTASE